MRIPAKFTSVSCALITHAAMAFGQGMPMGESLFVSTSSLKNPKPEEFLAYVKEIGPMVGKARPGVELKAFVGDRGKRKGNILLVCSSSNEKSRRALPAGSPFTDATLPANGKGVVASSFLVSPASYTEYRLMGGDEARPLPTVGILGIHFIKVRKDKAGQFERFVMEKVHPKTAHLLPDLQLLYYKAVEGDNQGSFITVFALKSEAARESFWPGGKAETDPLKNAFKPLKDLAVELSTYLEKDSYLKPESGGAAAYFESLEWTDFVLK